MPDVAEPARPTTPPAFLFHDRRRLDRRHGPRRTAEATIGTDRRNDADRREESDRRLAPDEQLWDALVMLDDLTQHAETSSESNRVIAGAARRMWLALAEFRRESGEHTLDTWLAERKAS